MYPRRELNRIAARKALLQARIAARRLQCELHAQELVRPLRWVDRALAMWRRISPALKLAGVPVGLVLGRRIAKRFGGKFGALVKYTPLAVQAARVFARRGRAA